MLRHLRPLALLLVWAAANAAFAAPHPKPVAIKDPVMVGVTGQLTDAQLRKAVRAALLNRGWKLENEQPGSLEAVVKHRDRQRTYTARVAVTYDAQKIVVRYVSSEGLEYDAGAKTIQADYNNWLDLLARDLPVYLTLVTE